MLLSDASIMAAIADGKIRIDPFAPNHLRPCSICLILGTELVLPDWRERIDIRREESYPPSARRVDLSESTYYLAPGEFALGATEERIAINNHVAGLVLGISGLARLGLQVSSPGLVSPGFGSETPSTITLEIANVGKSAISLVSGMRICHLAFAALDRPSFGNYDRDVSLYSGQAGPRLSHFFSNWR